MNLVVGRKTGQRNPGERRSITNVCRHAHTLHEPTSQPHANARANGFKAMDGSRGWL